MEVISPETCQEWFDSNNRREKIYPGELWDVGCGGGEGVG